MDVHFRTSRLQRAYEEHSYAVRLWGPDVGRRYVGRIDLLVAFAFDDVKATRALRCHQLTGKRAGQWGIDLIGRTRLVIEVSDDEKEARIVEVTEHYGD